MQLLLFDGQFLHYYDIFWLREFWSFLPMLYFLEPSQCLFLHLFGVPLHVSKYFTSISNFLVLTNTIFLSYYSYQAFMDFGFLDIFISREVLRKLHMILSSHTHACTQTNTWRYTPIKHVHMNLWMNMHICIMHLCVSFHWLLVSVFSPSSFKSFWTTLISHFSMYIIWLDDADACQLFQFVWFADLWWDSARS